MLKVIARIALLGLGVVGLYKFAPPAAPLVDKTFQEYAPKLGINTSIMGISTDPETETETENAAIKEVSEKAKDFSQEAQENITNFAKEELDKVKDTASKQFCEVLVEKVKVECEDSLNINPE